MTTTVIQMENIKLKLVRLLNAALLCTTDEKWRLERKFKSRQVYTYLHVPDQCFRSASKNKKTTSQWLVVK